MSVHCSEIVRRIAWTTSLPARVRIVARVPGKSWRRLQSRSLGASAMTLASSHLSDKKFSRLLCGRDRRDLNLGTPRSIVARAPCGFASTPDSADPEIYPGRS